MGMTGAQTPGEMRYRAFMSYSHRDEQVARKLHRWLEAYRLPRRLHADAGSRLVPIFRDRLELPAAADLDAQVKQALAISDALLVLGSPAASASPWVNAEIRLFRSLHPDRPIIVALLEGEPDESFPPALREADKAGRVLEPVAADFRKQGDGPKLARLKIVAGLSGVRLDQLIQRDAQRQMRRVTAVTLLALLIALLMGFMLSSVVKAQREAEHQRHQAEGLIEFMLTDLRARLKGVGRIDVLQSVNERALQFYGEQTDLSALPVDSLERRARILHAMGEDDQRRGDAAAALAKFREAHRVTATLLNAEPNDPDRIFAHAQSEFWVAYVDYVRERYQQALGGFVAYRDLARRLVKIAPQKVDYQRELAYADGNICSIALTRPKPSTELEACRNALETMQRIAAAQPDDASISSDLANRHAWMADALVLLGRRNEALAERTKQRAIIDALLKRDPRNASHLENWMLARYSTAKLLAEMGQHSQAAVFNTEARQMVARLQAADPENNDWRIWRQKLDLQMQSGRS